VAAGDDNLNNWASPTLTAPTITPPTITARRQARLETAATVETTRPSFSLPVPVAGVLDADGSSFVMLGLDGTPLAANQQALSMLGANSLADLGSGSTARGMLRSLLDHVPQQLLAEATMPGLEAGGTWQGDFDHTDIGGRQRIYRATVIVHHDANSPDAASHNGDCVTNGYIGIITHDVTTSRDESAKLRHRATHDPLTGLANRRQILARLATAIGDQRGRPGHVAVVFIDVDRLKYVNDALGHEVGDRLLVSTAQRLSDATRPTDQVARIGGDEFLVVCTELADPLAALDIAERIRRALSGRLRVNQFDLAFGVSIGVAMSDPDLFDLTESDAAAALISNADTAMYEAKKSGRARVMLFTSQMRSAARDRTELAAALAHAVAERQLDLEYQPVMSALSDTIVGAEALARWNHPTRGRIDPAMFVSIAEESGTIGRLGEFVLEQAMSDTHRWVEQRVVGPDFAVHVNVSHMQLASASFVNLVLALLRQHRLRPSQLVLEAREAALVTRNVEVERSVRALRRLGIRVAIDNFGTGANALSILTDIGADILKLDGSLALPSGSSDTDTRLVRAIVLLAHALSMQVVAERVSGPEQLRRLRAAGCDMVQGNLLGDPVSAERFALRAGSSS
jgi:diguanylate cyclase (GGDEF)-like protein